MAAARLCRCVSLLLAALQLLSCANLPSDVRASVADAPPTTWVEQQAYATAALPFSLQGRVGTSRGSANLRWRQRGEAFELRLWGPFGAGVAVLEGNPARVRLEREGLTREGDPATILEDEFGWRVPVAALAYWVRGLPAPEPEANGSAPALELSGGRVVRMQQLGWSIAIDRYAEQPDHGYLPARLSARQGDQRFSLAVQSWLTGQAADVTPLEAKLMPLGARAAPPAASPAGAQP